MTPNDPTDRPRAEAVEEKRHEVFEDHEALRAILARVEGSNDLRRLPLQLVELRSLLQDHFALEEAPDGMAAVVRDNAPNQLGKLEGIMAQHPSLLDALDEILDKARRVVNGPLAELDDDLRALCDRLREHEAEETRLLTDALYTDLGESP
jgi:Hemerythrin HHE cation binding domain